MKVRFVCECDIYEDEEIFLREARNPKIISDESLYISDDGVICNLDDWKVTSLEIIEL